MQNYRSPNFKKYQFYVSGSVMFYPKSFMTVTQLGIEQFIVKFSYCR